MSEKSERLLACMNDIRDEFIEEAARPVAGKRRERQKWLPAAASLVLVVGLCAYAFPWMGSGGDSATGSAAGGAANDVEAPGTGGSTFMSYAGPVFPLTLMEENSAVTARREITLDFEPYAPVWISNEEESARGRTEEARQEILELYNDWYPEGGRYERSEDILVTDAYTLTNASREDQTVTALYPFAASLYDVSEKLPVLTADGRELETALRAGGYSGGFMGVKGKGDTSSPLMNLDQVDSWEDYKSLLADGSYLERALGGYTDLSGIPVTVYKFTDPWGPEKSDSIPNPSIRVEFELDHSQTTVLSYRFNSGSWDEEAGWMGLGFDIPEEWQFWYGKPCYLIVLGEDVENMAYQGYSTGSWDAEDVVEAGVTIQRYETDLDAALRAITAGTYAGYCADHGEAVDYELYHALFCDHVMTYYGGTPGSRIARYDDGRLSGNDTEVMERVFYLETELTIPAGQSVTLTAGMTKEASFDYHSADTGNPGVKGYGLVTKLGSNLTCISQTATLEDRGQIEIVRQNFSFDLENGIKTVDLDVEQEHYYLEVKRVTEREEGSE